MRFWLDRFNEYKEKGISSYRAHKWRDARYNLLQASQILFRIAEHTEGGPLRRERVETARIFLERAKSIDPKTLAELSAIPLPADVESGEGSRNGNRWIVSQKPGVYFEDIAGLEEVKELLRRRVVYPFLHPEVAARYGKRAGGGVLLYGPPGTGKTMLAKAVATEVDATFFTVKSSDVMSKWVGEAEKNLRELFETARKLKRSVIFLDEVEAIVARRGGGSTVMNRVIPEFLSLVDGVDTKETALLILGATNRPWDMDEAALRTGRFGELIHVGLPDLEARKRILEIHLEPYPLASDVDLDALARELYGLTGADIAGFCERARDLPFEREMKTGEPSEVTGEDVEKAAETTRPSVSPRMLERYKRFGEEGNSC
jgi:transitional endoplasmic reticulum ATPase